MKVSLDVLQRVYETFQSGGETGGGEDDFLDPDNYLHLVNAYDMPLWNWSTERIAFERYGVSAMSPPQSDIRLMAFSVSGPLTISGSAESRVNAIRNRLNVIKQTVLRNDHFSPSTLPSKDREHLLTVRSLSSLLCFYPNISLATIDQAVTRQSRGEVSAVWHADTFKGRQAVSRGRGRAC